MKRLAGKTAMITGAGGAIGLGLCRRFAGEGANLVVLDLTEAGAEKAAQAAEGVQVLRGVCDIRDSASIRKIVAEAEEKLGGVDILVNNAGGSAGLLGKLTRFVDAEEDTLRYVIDINLMGTMYASQAVLPGMIRKNYGKIINMASVAGVAGMKDRVDYSAAKGGIISMTYALAMEVGKYNICVNAISPGMIMRGSQNTNGGTYLGPEGRPGTAEDIAAMAAFLASAEADYITGQNYCVDGGRCIGPKVLGPNN